MFDKDYVLLADWNNLAWQEYKVPSDTPCSNQLEIHQEVICLADKGHYFILESLNAEWLYKMVAWSGMKVSIATDITIVELVRSWI